ncbi:hypothetical protein, partial [Nonomuraea sp. NPDC049784]|uniref:hypothetical protein n=1 Tax=Nonomuraea sp. NPDC049784 TaxID=3154361 RepID=UPI0033C20F96
MLVHGVWSAEGLAFWAESPDTTPSAAQERQAQAGAAPPATRRRQAPGGVPHPFAASAAGIATALGLDEPPSRTLELLLPGSAKEPLPSPETGRLAEVARPRLRLWQVP